MFSISAVAIHSILEYSLTRGPYVWRNFVYISGAPVSSVFTSKSKDGSALLLDVDALRYRVETGLLLHVGVEWDGIRLV